MKDLHKILQQAQQMQQKMEAAQQELANELLEVSAAGGAVRLKINGQGRFQGLIMDPEFLKEDAATIEATLLSAIQEAQEKAKAIESSRLSKVTGGLPLPF
jgi:DNA-binding YbaB/EbfC family protein